MDMFDRYHPPVPHHLKGYYCCCLIVVVWIYKVNQMDKRCNSFRQLLHGIAASSTARNIQDIRGGPCTICLQSNKIKRNLDRSSLEHVVHAFITTKCNSLLCGAPSSLINKRQRIQNITARIITGHGGEENTSLEFCIHLTGYQSGKGFSSRLSSLLIRSSTNRHQCTCRNCYISMCHWEGYTLVIRTCYPCHSQSQLLVRTVRLVSQGLVVGIVCQSTSELMLVYQKSKHYG